MSQKNLDCVSQNIYNINSNNNNITSNQARPKISVSQNRQMHSLLVLRQQQNVGQIGGPNMLSIHKLVDLGLQKGHMHMHAHVSMMYECICM